MCLSCIIKFYASWKIQKKLSVTNEMIMGDVQSTWITKLQNIRTL